jgi:hypothetical protein
MILHRKTGRGVLVVFSLFWGVLTVVGVSWTCADGGVVLRLWILCYICIFYAICMCNLRPEHVYFIRAVEVLCACSRVYKLVITARLTRSLYHLITARPKSGLLYQFSA